MVLQTVTFCSEGDFRTNEMGTWDRIFCMLVHNQQLSAFALFAPHAQFPPVLQYSVPAKTLSLHFQTLSMFLFFQKASLLRCCVNTLPLCTALSSAMPSRPEGQRLLQSGLVCTPPVCPAVCEHRQCCSLLCSAVFVL